MFNDKFKKIDDSYFSNYGGDEYPNSYLKYTTSPRLVVRDLIYNGIDFKSILDVGCASGEVVRDFRRLGIEAYGVENNAVILEKCVAPDYCVQGDLYDMSEIKDSSIDVIYCNALMYVFPQDMVKVLKSFNRISRKAVFLCCPFLDNGNVANDPYRVFLAKKSWWEKQFKEANFKKISDNIYAV